MSQYGLHPDWVMLGVPYNGQFMIYASKDMRRTELEVVVPDLDPWDMPLTRPDSSQRVIVLTTTMGEVVFVAADSYAEALTAILKHWNPDPQPAPLALDPARRELDHG